MNIRIARLLGRDLDGRKPRNDVSRWERGRHIPTGRHLSAIAEALETTIPDLLGAKPPPEPIEQAELRRALARLDRRLARIERLLEGRNGRHR